MKITCRGLAVNATATVTVDPDETVADLKRKLDVDRPGRRKCSLYHEGRKLESSVRLGSLKLSVGSFLTVIERKSNTSGNIKQQASERRRQPQEGAQPLAGSCSSNAPAEHTAAPAAGSSNTDACKAGAAVGAGFFVAPDTQKKQPATELETLLPGYASRPNPSPVKKQRTAHSHPLPTSPQLPSAPLPPRPPAEAAGIAHRLRGCRHKAAIQDKAGPQPVVQDDGENPRHDGSSDSRAASSSLCRASRRASSASGSTSSGGPAPSRTVADKRAKGGEAGSTEALTRRDVELLIGLPLPPALGRLHRIFQRLNLLNSFLVRHHIPVQGGLYRMQMTWRNVRDALWRHLSCDCPEHQDLEDMCKLCPTVVFFRDRQWAQRRGAYGVHNDPEPQQHTTDAGQGSEARQKLGQDRAETLSQLMKDVKPEEVQDFVFEVADPGRSWLLPSKGAKSSQPVPIVQDLPAPGTGETMQQEQADNVAARSGAEVRREQAFRLGLALAVQHLQDTVLERAAGCAAAERVGVATSDAEFVAADDVLAPLVQELVHRSQLQQPGNTAASGSCDGGNTTQAQPAAAAGCSWDWDVLDRRCWHPLLDISKIGLAQLRAAQLVAADSDVQDKDGVEGSSRNGFEWEDLESHGTGSRHPRRRQAQERAPRPPGLMKRHPTCTSTDALDPDGILDHLKSLPWYENQAVHEHSIPARPARYAEPQVPLSEGLKQALAAKNVKRLFLHQAMALDALARGQHIVVSTSTASGKSLCYNIPILQALVERSDASALYMFPTKALAQDQLRALQELCRSLFPSQQGPCIDVYDGDTPQADRPAIRQRVQLLITNPDMLHRSILPVHQQFQRFLSCLRYVVVDELHSYTGVFGCHTALVLRRLRRLCHHRYPSPDSAQDRPQFIATSATTGNPETHALQLLGVTNVQVISEDGSPHGAKRIVLWNPPLTLKAKALAAARAARKAEQPAPGSMSEAVRGAGSGGTADSQQMDDASLLSKPGPSRKRYRGRAALRRAVEGKSQGQLHDHRTPASELAELAAQAVLKRHRSAAASLKTGAAGDEAGKQPSLQGLADAGDGGGSAGEGQREDGPGHGPCRDSEHDTAAASSKNSAEAAGAAEADCSAASEERSGPEAAGRPVAMALSKGHKSLARSLVSSQASHREVERPLIRLKGGSYPATSRQIVLVQPGMEPGVTNRQLDEAAKAAQRRMPGPEWKDRSGAAGTPRALRRVSPMVQISMLLAECIQHGLRTIAFCHTRKLAELVTALTRESLNASAPHLAERLCVYRAGYQPEQRRAIEKALFQGRLRAVAATNALELGLDVGFLDCTLHLGFPPSIASLWQQAGRAGRREQTSLAIVVGFDSPMDQFYFKNPDYLFGRPLERAQVDPQNPGLLEQHAACAAFEHPLVLDKDEAFLGPGLRGAALNLVRGGQLAANPGVSSAAAGLHYTGPQSMPSAPITLRAIDPERYSIVNEATGEVIEEIEECMAFYSIYDGAVYMYQGRPHLCKKMDLSSKVAVVRPADVKYYTTTRDFSDVHVIGSHGAYPVLGPPGSQPSADSAAGASDPPTSARWGEALVTTRFLGFHRIWQGSGKLFDTVDLFLPDVQYHTEAAYIRVPARARTACQDAGLLFREGVHAAAHSIMNILHLYVMCNPGDVGSECESPYEERYRPERLLVYDRHPGGIGLAAQARPLFTLLLRQALLLVESCDCELSTGCPQCVHRTDCPEYNAMVDKEAAKLVLRHTLQVELERWGETAPSGSVEGVDNSPPAVGPWSCTCAAADAGGGAPDPNSSSSSRRRSCCEAAGGPS